MTALLEVKNLKTKFINKYSQVTVVDGIDFHIAPGEILGIVGESGCGKSVTSLSIMRLLASNAKISGEINFNGINLLSLNEREMRKVRGNDIAMIFQEPMTSLNPLHSIGKQIMEPLRKHLKISKRDAKEKAIKLLKDVGIPRAEKIFHEYPYQLSGGMRQRVMIAMAMACKPKLIIADEPTTALDVTIQAQILELMNQLQKTNGTAVMLITHDLGVVAEVCHRVVVMYAGQVVEEADVHSLFSDPKHPYTQGLMKSIPSMTEDKERLEAIPGHVPSLSQMPKGCRFAPRCPMAMEICFRKVPSLDNVSENHRSRCWLYAKENVE